MEWTNRPNRPENDTNNNPDNRNTERARGTDHESYYSGGRKRVNSTRSFLNLSSFALLASLSILAIAFILFSVFYRDSNPKEKDFVKPDRMQAVFLSGGQVYFGKIRTINNKYIGLSDIFYLRVNQRMQPKQGDEVTTQNVELVKLGCELHAPEDWMSINRDQVIFWENLKSDGQVAQKINEIKQNPDAYICKDKEKQEKTDSGTPNQQQGNTNQNNSQQNSNTTPSQQNQPSSNP